MFFLSCLCDPATLWLCVYSVCWISVCRLCREGWEQWGVVNEELWCLQSYGPNEGLFSSQHGLQWSELAWVFWRGEMVVTDTVTKKRRDDWNSSRCFIQIQLEVLDLLSPAQKAELLLRPEIAGLDNGTLALVFSSLMTGGPGTHPTPLPGGCHQRTSHGQPPTYPPETSCEPYRPPPPHNNLKEVL